MDYKKIKKSQTSLAGITFAIIIAIVIFTAAFYWIQTNATESGRPVDSMYNESFTNLQNEQNNLSDTITDLRNSASNITEADSIFSVAWNGLKGLVNIFTIPLQLVTIGWQSFEVITSPLAGIIPEWLLVLIRIGIIAIIIFVIIAILKGDNKVIN